MSTSRKILHRLARKRRIRARVSGTAERPRLCVHRSLRALTVQVIDDAVGRTMVAASTREMSVTPTMDGAKKLGTLVAEKAKKERITAVVFDRNAYRYHGRVKAIAEAARAGGLKM